MRVGSSSRSVALRVRDFLLRHPSGDWLVGVALVALVRFGDGIPGIAHPPSEPEKLGVLVASASTNLWALFAAVLTALVFFYGLQRGEWIRRAEDLAGSRMYRAWRSSIHANFWFAVAMSIVVDPLPLVGWLLVLAAGVLTLRVLRVVYLVLDHITLLRKGWAEEGAIEEHAQEQRSRPSIPNRFSS